MENMLFMLPRINNIVIHCINFGTIVLMVAGLAIASRNIISFKFQIYYYINIQIVWFFNQSVFRCICFLLCCFSLLPAHDYHLVWLRAGNDISLRSLISWIGCIAGVLLILTIFYLLLPLLSQILMLNYP